MTVPVWWRRVRWKDDVLVSGYQSGTVSNKRMEFSQVRKHRGLPRLDSQYQKSREVGYGEIIEQHQAR